MLNIIEPPRGAIRLLSLFAGESDLPQIEGDLREEFHQILSQFGPDEARRWYWRQAWRNVWSLIKRPSVINVLGGAALCVAIFRLVIPLLFRWMRFELSSGPRVPALGFVLITFLEIATVVILGGVASRILRGHERLVRLTFTVFYLLTIAQFTFFSGIYAVWLSEPLRFAMDQFGLLCVISSFWIGSVVISQARIPPTAVGG